MIYYGVFSVWQGPLVEFALSAASRSSPGCPGEGQEFRYRPKGVLPQKGVPRILTHFWRISDAFWNVPLFPIKQDPFWRISDAFLTHADAFSENTFWTIPRICVGLLLVQVRVRVRVFFVWGGASGSGSGSARVPYVFLIFHFCPLWWLPGMRSQINAFFLNGQCFDFCLGFPSREGVRGGGPQYLAGFSLRGKLLLQGSSYKDLTRHLLVWRHVEGGPGCFKPGCLPFLCGSALLHSLRPFTLFCEFVLFCALLRSFACFCVRPRLERPHLGIQMLLWEHPPSTYLPFGFPNLLLILGFPLKA